MLCPCQTAQGGRSSLLTIVWCMHRGGNVVSMPDRTSAGAGPRPDDSSLEQVTYFDRVYGCLSEAVLGDTHTPKMTREQAQHADSA